MVSYANSYAGGSGTRAGRCVFLRGLRRVHYATWLARRWHDPIFPANWPHFGTEAYWLQETAYLEEQLRLAREDLAPRAPAAQPEPLLSNKDYFWDWEGD